MQYKVTPNSIVIYPEKSSNSANKQSFGSSFPRLSLNHAKNGDVSKKAQKRLRNAINWLTVCSKPRTINVGNHIKIPHFQVAFITLTLPSKQMHSHKELKNVLLNHFFTILRSKFKVRNYLWKAELQSNGNIHFHVTIDKYIHYMALRKYWNKVLNTLGYVDRYAERMRQLSFEDYQYYENLRGNTDTQAIKKAYAFGVSTNWQSPNTTDIKSVQNVKNLAAYLSKYMVKELEGKDKTGPIADSVKSFSGRVWFLSRSLSRLSGYRAFYDFKTRRILAKFEKLKGVYTFMKMFCSGVFFKLDKLPYDLREFIRQHIFAHANECRYYWPAPTPSLGVPLKYQL